MFRVVIGYSLRLGVAAICWASLANTLHAQDIDPALQKRIDDEKAARRGCKVSICDVARNKKSDGPDISCDVIRTWTSSELKEKILKGKFDWPWSHMQCKTKVVLDRKLLARMLSGESFEAKISKHAVACSLDQKDSAEKYPLNFSIAPTVSFKDGKATKTALNWSDIDGATVAKAAMWSTATLDNNLGVLDGVMVQTINSFFDEQCDEVKGEFAK